ncbi:Uncharacterized protein TCM_031258 [Theobroma cacao]|uniref:Uncharacterized protein n=1 Tax=Theobroma cacao TaxID=3641 RepID=A0A061F7T2_THECC|nr:Uncharacterized protein TCM_031258 [Theobroma cacao]
MPEGVLTLSCCQLEAAKSARRCKRWKQPWRLCLLFLLVLHFERRYARHLVWFFRCVMFVPSVNMASRIRKFLWQGMYSSQGIDSAVFLQAS